MWLKNGLNLDYPVKPNNFWNGLMTGTYSQKNSRQFLEWIDDWNLFTKELQTNFGPYDQSADVEHELVNLCMKDNQ